MYQEKYFPRVELKHRGKASLAGHWKVAIAITIITMLLTGILVYAQPNAAGMDGMITADMDFEAFNAQMMQQQAMDPGTLAMLQLIGLVTSILINGVLALASIKWYLSVAQRLPDTRFSDFISNFSYGLKGALAYLWQTLWLIIWSFVYMIPVTVLAVFGGVMGFSAESPGILITLSVAAFIIYAVLIIRKGLSYSQQFYVVGDNPHIGVRRALRLSMAMTRGRLGDLFLLGLSFIGWFLTIPLTVGISALYVMPYVNATYTQTYLWLRDRALDNGIMDPDIFGLVKTTHGDVPPAINNVSTSQQELRNERIESLPNASDRDIENLDRALGKTMYDETGENNQEATEPRSEKE